MIEKDISIEEIREECLFALNYTNISKEGLAAIIEAIVQIRGSEANTERQAFAEAVMYDLGQGHQAGLVRHDREQTLRLVQRLSNPEQKLSFAAVVCPDYANHIENREVVYELGKLNGGLPETARVLLDYLQVLSKRSLSHQEEVSYTLLVAGWEKADEQGNIPLKDYELLESSVNTINTEAERLGIHHLKVLLSCPPSFRRETDARIADWAPKNRLCASLREVRRDIQGDNYQLLDAARELAEAETAWGLTDKNDIIVVPTSPSIARPVLNKMNRAWIQLVHGYRG